MKRDKIYKIGFFLVLGLLGALILLPLLMPYESPLPPPAGASSALLVSYTLDYFLNEAVEDEIVFYVSMANYGFTDATNIEVACELFEQDSEGALLDRKADYTVTKTFDKIEKTSTEELTITGLGINDINQQSSYVGLCKVISCEDCEVLGNRLIN